MSTACETPPGAGAKDSAARSGENMAVSAPVSRWRNLAPWLFVVAIIALSCALNARWIHQNQLPPVNDEAMHVYNAMRLFDHTNEPRLDNYPPVTYAVTGAMFAMYGRSTQTALGALTVFLALYVVSMAWLGHVTGGRRGAVLFTLIAAGTPWIVEFSHLYLVDLPLASLVALSFAALVASDDYRRMAPCCALGFGIGLGMLTKWSFAYFVPAAMLIALIRAWWNERGVGRALFVYAGIAAGATLDVLVVSLETCRRSGSEAPAATLFVLMLVWSVNLACAYLLRRKAGAASGFVVALSLGFLLCLPWYCRHLYALSQIGARYLGFPTPPFASALYACLWMLSRFWWLAPLWGAIGLWQASDERLRGPYLMAAGSVGAAIVALSWTWNPEARYLLPLCPMVTLMAFGWGPRCGRFFLPLTAMVAIVATIQSAAWLPWFSRIAEMTAPLDKVGYKVQDDQGATSPLFGPTRAGQLDTHLLTWRVPSVPAPPRGVFPLCEMLLAAQRHGCRNVMTAVPPPADPIRYETLRLVALEYHLDIHLLLEGDAVTPGAPLALLLSNSVAEAQRAELLRQRSFVHEETWRLPTEPLTATGDAGNGVAPPGVSAADLWISVP